MVEDFWEIIKENIWGMICKKVVELYGKLKSEFHDQFSHLTYKDSVPGPLAQAPSGLPS